MRDLSAKLVADASNLNLYICISVTQIYAKCKITIVLVSEM